MKVVRAAFGDDVDDAAGRAAKLRGVRVCIDLIFLHGLLRDSCAGGVDRVVGEVGTVDLDQSGAAALTADVKSGGRGGADRAAVVTVDGRDRQGKPGRTALVDGQILDPLLVDRVGDAGA